MPKLNLNECTLTVCLITRNQPEKVDEILSVFCDFLSMQSVEFIVNDGSSNELTKIIVNRHNLLGNIRLICDESRSLDDALINTLEIAQGKYIWNIGDDIPHSDALVKILNILQGDDGIDFLWINSEEEGAPSNKTLSLDCSTYIDNKDELLKYDVGLLGFISSIIYKKSAAFSCIDDAKRFAGSIFVSLFISLSVLARNGKIYIEKESLLKSRPKFPGEKRWYDPYEVFGINIKKILNEFEVHFSKTSYDNAVKSNIKRVLKAIIYERSIGCREGFAASNFKLFQFFAHYYKYPSTWLYIPALYLPSSGLKLMFPLKRLKRGLKNGFQPEIFKKFQFYLRGTLWRVCRRGYIYARGDSYSGPSSNGEFLTFNKTSFLFEKDPVLIDIGANEGIWIENSLVTLDAKQGKKIYAFEPASNAYQQLRCRYEGVVTLANTALGDENCMTNLNIYGSSVGINSLHRVEGVIPISVEKIQMEKFDSFYARNQLKVIDYVKSDTEGNCFNVLKGAEECLNMGFIKFWQFEYNYRWLVPGHSLLNVFKFIENKPYLLAKINKNGLVIYRQWHFELDRYFEANYLLVREDLVKDLRDFATNAAFDKFNVSMIS